MRHLSLFSGIGGFDLAAEWMGWDNVAHCEILQFNRNILNHHFPGAHSYGDIKQFDGTKYTGTIDIISGGFPCQDISIAKTHIGGGKIEGIKGERSGLWKEYDRIIRQVGPGIIVFENSSMLTSRGLEVVLCDLHQLGFDAEWRYFYAAQFGYPHFRPRIYCVAYSRSHRWNTIAKKGGILQKVLLPESPRQDRVPMPSKRFNGRSDFSGLQLDDGFPSAVDQDSIYAFGNAVIPDIPYAIFKAIEQYENEI